MIKLKKIFKRPFYIISFIIIGLLLFFLIGLKITFNKVDSKIDSCKHELTKIANTMDKINIVAKDEFERINSPDLLLDNINMILTTLYYGTADKGDVKEDKNFTGFSMQYNDKFYIITAGHCIEFDGQKYNNFKFKPSKGENWLKPELLDYKSDYKNNNDYAIFYLDNPIHTGLIPAKPGEDMTPKYILGNLERNLNLVKQFGDTIEGESGSPVLNSNCHVIGVVIKSDGAYTPISVVLDALYGLSSYK